MFAVGFEGLLFRHEEGGLLHVAGRFFIKRKGHLFYSLEFIPPLNKRGCLGAGYFWFLSSYWFFLGLVISSPRIGQSLTHFSLKQVGLTITVFSSMGRLRTKFFFWFYIFCNWSNLFKKFWVFAFFRCLICFFCFSFVFRLFFGSN